MANGLDLKERTSGRVVPESDPLMELSRIMGFDQPAPEESRVDPQIAAEDSFSMDLERELAFEEVPADSGSFDAEFAAAFEDDLSETLRFEPDAPSVVPSLEDELSALLANSVPGNAVSGVKLASPDDDVAEQALFEEDGLVLSQTEEDLVNPAAASDATAEWQRDTASSETGPAFPWPEVARDDALEAELESRPATDNRPLPEPVFNLEAGEGEEFEDLDPESDLDDFVVEAGVNKPEPEFAGELAGTERLEFSGYQDLELEEPAADIQMDTRVEPVVGDSEYNPEDGFDAFRELAAFDLPPAPEFAEWPAASTSVSAEPGVAEADDAYEVQALEELAPLVEASEPKLDEVSHTDDFDIPDFEFQALNDAPKQFDSYDELADEIELEHPVQSAKSEDSKPAFDDSDFDFDSLIGEEMAAGAGAVALGASAMTMRGSPSMHVDADVDADPFQRTPIADDVFAPVAVEPSGRKPWLVPVALAGIMALFGGGLYYAFSGDGASLNAEGPALVKADPEPVKIAPENPGGATVANQDKAVYDKVEGDQASLPAQGALVSVSEEPVDIAAVAPPAEPEEPVETAAAPVEASAASEATAKAEDRVETPATEAVQAPAAETAAVTPKKVRTVIVKPDGTLVERPVEATPAAIAEPSAETPAPESSQVASIAPADAPAPEVVAAAPVPAAKPDVAAAAPVDAVAAVEDPIAQIAAVEPEGAKVAEPAPAELVAKVVQPEPVAAEPVIKVVKAKKIKAPAAEVVSAPAAPADTAPFGERPADQPVNIVGQTGGQQPAAETQVAAADPAPAPAAGAYSIQIASTPSPEAAKSTYAALSRKFGGVIGGKGVNIQKANVEGKGTVYRVRIPAGSKQDANSLCSQYKSAGGSCFVTR